MATKVGLRHGVHVIFEEVLPGGNCLAVNVVRGEAMFPCSVPAVAEATAPRKRPGNNARGPYKKRSRRPDRKTTPAEREGVQELLTAVVAAFKRAEGRVSEDPVYHKMMLPSNRFCIWATIRRLRDMDATDFRPGAWFEASKYFNYKNGRTFEELVQRVEADVDGFTWAW